MLELEPITREEKFLNGEVGMTPITREEKILAGEDIETVTRREYFLKKYRGGGGGDVTVVPLSVTENGTYSEEGKAYSPVQVSVPDPVLKTKSITDNGTYNASADNADGYSSVDVNVPLPTNAYLLKSVNTPTPIASFSDGEEMVMPSLKVAIEPQQDLHGYDSPWVGGAGKNKLVNASDTYDISQATYHAYNVSPSISANTTVTLSIDCDLVSTKRLMVYTSSGDLIKVGDNGSKIITFSSTSDLSAFRLYIGNYDETVTHIIKAQLELGNTATTFEPYSNICPISGYTEVDLTVADDVDNPTVENVYTIDLDGTHYGGEVDVVNGTMTVDRAYIDMGSPTWSYTNNRFYYNPTNAKVYTQIEVANLLCSHYPNSQYNSQADNSISSYAGYIYVRADSYSGDTTAFKQAMNGVQLVYELATPLTIQLTPTAIKSLRGVNNVFANTGDITDAEYFSKEV